MNKKLIFLDIDGTLTSPGSNVPPRSALDAIGKAQAAGHKVFLCTGRNLDMLSPLLAYGFDGAVASGGGYVVCGDKVLYDCPMTEEQRLLAMDLLAQITSSAPSRRKTPPTATRAWRNFWAPSAAATASWSAGAGRWRTI